MNADGMSSRCVCGATTLTHLSKGKLQVTEPQLTKPCDEQPVKWPEVES